MEGLSRCFRLHKINDEPAGLMSLDRFCVLERDHLEFTDHALSIIEKG